MIRGDIGFDDWRQPIVDKLRTPEVNRWLDEVDASAAAGFAWRTSLATRRTDEVVAGMAVRDEGLVGDRAFLRAAEVMTNLAIAQGAQ